MGADSEQGKAMPINDVIANVQDAYTLGFKAGVESTKARLDLAEKKLAEFGQVWENDKYVFDGLQGRKQEK